MRWREGDVLPCDDGSGIVCDQRVGGFNSCEGSNSVTRFREHGTPQFQIVSVAGDHVDGFVV